MICKACKQEHSGMLSCSRAARIAAYGGRASPPAPALLRPLVVAVVERDIMASKAPIRSDRVIPDKRVGITTVEPVSLTTKSHEFDRAAYQREYMRKRRADLKALAADGIDTSKPEPKVNRRPTVVKEGRLAKPAQAAKRRADIKAAERQRRSRG